MDTAATTSRQWLKAKIGNSMPSFSQISVRMVGLLSVVGGVVVVGGAGRQGGRSGPGNTTAAVAAARRSMRPARSSSPSSISSRNTASSWPVTTEVVAAEPGAAGRCPARGTARPASGRRPARARSDRRRASARATASSRRLSPMSRRHSRSSPSDWVASWAKNCSRRCRRQRRVDRQGEVAQAGVVVALVDDGAQQVGLRAEVVVQRGDVEVAGGGELAHGHALDAVGGDEVGRRRQDLRARRGRRGADPWWWRWQRRWTRAPLGIDAPRPINRLIGNPARPCGAPAGTVPPVLFPQRFHAGLADGSITLAFRRWRQPAAKAGGRQRTPVGELAIDAVDAVTVRRRDRGRRPPGRLRRPRRAARRAGPRHPDGTLYRIALHLAGADPRIALRERAELTDDEWRGRRRPARPPRPVEPARPVDHDRAAPHRRAPRRAGPDLAALAGPRDAAVQDRRPQAQGDGPDREPGRRLPALAPGPPAWPRPRLDAAG